MDQLELMKKSMKKALDDIQELGLPVDSSSIATIAVSMPIIALQLVRIADNIEGFNERYEG